LVIERLLVFTALATPGHALFEALQSKLLVTSVTSNRFVDILTYVLRAVLADLALGAVLFVGVSFYLAESQWLARHFQKGLKLYLGAALALAALLSLSGWHWAQTPLAVLTFASTGGLALSVLAQWGVVSFLSLTATRYLCET
jgi:hypothetical protein